MLWRTRPVPAPRRNKTPLPSNQGAALSAQAPDPLSPRAAPTTSQRQQTTAFNPAQSPTSPRMPGVFQPVATSESLIQCVMQQICQNDKDIPRYCW